MNQMSTLLSSERPDWNTPDELLNLVRRVGPIGLDPCSNAASIVRAAVEWTEADDGLARDWRGYGLVFVNPPYGRLIAPWTAKLRVEGARGVEAIALLPARTDTRWWQEDVATADAICFWRGRLTFLGAPDPAPFPSAIAYWGPRPAAFRRAFSGWGWMP